MNNRYQLEAMKNGVAKELADATESLEKMYMNPQTKAAQREAQKAAVADIKERLEGIAAQIAAMDEAAAAKFARRGTENPGDKLVCAKAELYRSTLQKRPAGAEYKAALKDDGATGGDQFLPRTVAAEIISEPVARNPLRGISAMTNIPNLEIPRIAFSLDDDDFIEDGATAKELTASGANVAFGRHKFKVFVDISETVLMGTDTNLVATVDAGLESGLAKKEKKVAFALSPKTGEEHMSFYSKTAGVYDIKAMDCPAGTSAYKAIKAALGDLEEDYRENARICLRYADYLDMIEELAAGNATLYGVPPEQVLGKPVVFCDFAKIPVVGDFSYSHFNYDLGMLYEHDKNVKSGMDSFVLTAWFDHQIKLRSAFRLATVKESSL